MSLEKVFQDLRAAIEKYNNSSTESSKFNTPEFNAFEVLYALALPLSRMIDWGATKSQRNASTGECLSALFYQSVYYKSHS